jgi:CRP-like cAMP-binding protein
MTTKKTRSFNTRTFLESAGLGKQVVTHVGGDIIFSQGDPSDSVMYIRSGAVQLSVLSRTGREAIVGTQGPGDFLGEEALAGHRVRLVSARATMVTTVLVVPKRQMLQLLHSEHAFSDRFIAHMLARNARLESDLVDQLFNSSEKRLARTLLLLARYGKKDKPGWVLPRISQEALAEMVGTTRSRVNFFMNKFKKLGFVEYNGDLKINPSLVAVVVHDSNRSVSKDTFPAIPEVSGSEKKLPRTERT